MKVNKHGAVLSRKILVLPSSEALPRTGTAPTILALVRHAVATSVDVTEVFAMNATSMVK
jgi:hypothetical protein